MNIDDIRAMYPHPESAEAGNTSTRPCAYCVGGAFMMVKYQLALAKVGHACQVRFPTADQLAEEFLRVNPQLTTEMAYAIADALTSSNDAEDFEAAWACLAEALTYTKEEPV